MRPKLTVSEQPFSSIDQNLLGVPSTNSKRRRPVAGWAGGAAAATGEPFAGSTSTNPSSSLSAIIASAARAASAALANECDLLFGAAPAVPKLTSTSTPSMTASQNLVS